MVRKRELDMPSSSPIAFYYIFAPPVSSVFILFSIRFKNTVVFQCFNLQKNWQYQPNLTRFLFYLLSFHYVCGAVRIIAVYQVQSLSTVVYLSNMITVIKILEIWCDFFGRLAL